jgi:hypothetical protein
MIFSRSIDKFLYACRISLQQNKFCNLLIATAATLIFIPAALAESLGEYCVTQVNQKNEPTKVDSSTGMTEPQLTITIPTANGIFQVETERARLTLKRKDSSTPLAQVLVPQVEFNRINSLSLTKSQWLWVDGPEIDYMVALNLSSTPPTFGTPVTFPKISPNPCAMLWDFFGPCLRAESVYSPTLDRAFTVGHRVNFFGLPELTAYEMTMGKVKELPAPLQRARFLVDIPKLKGAMFTGAANEALFYNGSSVTTLLGAFPYSSPKDPSREWRILRAAPQRTFLTNLGFRNQPSYFLKELIAGPKLIPISFSPEIEGSWLSLISKPSNPRLWGLSRYAVVTSVKGSLKPVIKVKEPFYFDTSNNLEQETNGTVEFDLRHLKTGSTIISYSITKTLSKKQCKTVLSDKKTILLGN